MADKNYKIKILTEVDKKGVTDLKDELKKAENQTVKPKVDTSQIEQELSEAIAEVERLEDALDDAHLNGDDIEADIIADDLATARAEAERLQSELDSVNEVNVDVDVDDSEVDGLKEKVENASDNVDVDVDVDGEEQVDRLKDKVEEASSDINYNVVIHNDEKLDALGVKIEETSDTITLDFAYENDKQLDAIIEKIENTDGKLINVNVNVDGEEQIDAVSDKISNVNGKTINVNVDVDGDEQIDAVGDKIDSISNKLTGLAGGLGMVDQATKMWEASSNRQFQSFYLGANIGQQEAGKMQKKIQDIVASTPGDDTFMNQLLVTTVAQNKELANQEDQIKKIASVSADYMAGSKMMGKMNLESQQDIYKYILDGNTAELERGSIVSSQIDLLKDKNTVQERALAMEQALTNMGYTGISNYETAQNKLEEFTGQLDKSRADLGDLFLPLEQGALESALAINDQTGGALTSLIVIGQMVVPTAVAGLSAIAEIGKGLEELGKGWGKLKDNLEKIQDKFGKLSEKWNNVKTSLSNGINSLKNSFNGLKTTVTNVASTIKGTFLDSLSKVSNFMKNTMIPAVKDLALKFVDLGKKTLMAGYNALKSAGMWIVQKAQLVATYIVNGLVTVSQWALNFAMSMNPITIIILAIIALIAVLTYLYFNNEQVREAIDGLGQTLMNIGGLIYDSLINAWNTLISTLQNGWAFIQGLGQQIWNTVSSIINNILANINSFIQWFSTIPQKIGAYLSSIISKVISWGSQMISNFLSAGSKSLNNFISYISQIPQKLGAELSNALNKVNEWASTLPQKFWEAGVNAVKNFLSALGIASPGTMQRMLVWEVTEMGKRIPTESQNLLRNVRNLGENIVDEFGDSHLKLDNVQLGNSSISANNNGEGITQVNNFYFEDTVVDDDDRMERIADYIAKRISWNNTTAGRTV